MKLALWLAPLILTGCMTVHSLDGVRMPMTSAQFRFYVERVFREQNRVAGDIALLLEDPDLTPQHRARLEAAESDLGAACAGLNRLAVAERDGLNLGRIRRLRLARQAPDCEAATAAATAVAAI